MLVRVLLVVVAILIAIGVGALRGGSFGRLADIELRRRRFVLLAVVAQFGGGLAALAGSETGYEIGLAVSAVAALAFCIRNIAVAGVAMIGLGLALNALVVGLNAGMPVSIVKAATAGVSITEIAAGNDPRHNIAGIDSHLDWLGDDIPVVFPVSPEVVSPGDVLVAAGLLEFVVVAMGARRSPPGRSRGRPPARHLAK